MRFLAPDSASSSIRRKSPRTKSLPSRSNISSRRTRTRSAVVARARMSTVTLASARSPKAANISMTSLFSRKSVPTRIGGRFIPSSNRAFADSGMPPGSTAPVSVVCERAAVQPTSSPPKNTGMIATWSGLWIPP